MITITMVNNGVIRLRYFLTVCCFLVVAASTPVQAAQYKYDYYSNFFSGTGDFTINNPDGSTQTLPGIFDGFINAAIYSPVLLTSGSGLPSSATVTFEFYTLGPGRTPELQQTLSYPSTEQPDNSLTFVVGAVDDSGLPLDWNIAINHTQSSPGMGSFNGSIFISTHLDGITATFDGKNSYNGSIANVPGDWNLTAVVPEIGTRLMLLTGLCLIGLTLFKRKSR